MAKPYNMNICMAVEPVMSQLTKKTVFLNQDNIDKAIKLFDVKTEKEAINRALEMVIEEGDIIESHRALAGTAEIDDVFA
jgi:Arc/MetJ family transcription regulator